MLVRENCGAGNDFKWMGCFLAIISFCVVWFAGCTGNDSPSEQTDKPFQLAGEFDSSSQTSGAIAEATEVTGNLNQKTDISGNLPEYVSDLMRMLAQRQAEEQRTSDRQLQFKLQVEREQIATKMLTMELTPEQRFQAIRAKLDALLKLIALGDPEAQANLEKFATGLTDDEQSEVAEGASVALLVSDMSARIKDPGSDMQPVLAKAAKLADRYPDSFEIVKELADLAAGMLRVSRRDEAIQLLRVLEDHYAMNKNQKIGELVASISNRIRIAELNFDLIMNDLRLKKDGAIENYQAAIEALVSSGAINPYTFQEITKSLLWLESNDSIAAAREANEIVWSSADRIPDGNFKTALKRQCEMRSRRLGMLGKPLKFEAQTAAGGDLDWSRYQGKIVLVLFWSTSEPASLQSLNQLASVYESKKHLGLEFLAVNLTPNLNPLATLFGDKLPDWTIAVDETRASSGPYNALSERLGVVGAPYVAIVNRQGNVVYVTATGRNLMERIDTQLALQ